MSSLGAVKQILVGILPIDWFRPVYRWILQSRFLSALDDIVSTPDGKKTGGDVDCKWVKIDGIESCHV